MNTLGEIVAFVGISGPSSKRLFPLPGQPMLAPTLRNVGIVVTLLTDVQRTSMRSMIQGLQNLPPISLEAEGLELVVEEGDIPQINVKPSTGQIIQTTLSIFRNGVLVFPSHRSRVGASGGIVDSPSVSPGFYQFVLTRVGIPNTGVIALKQSFNVTSNLKSKPGPLKPVPPQVIPPTISVKSNGDGSFVVNGSGFLKSTKITIRVADTHLQNLLFVQTSTPEGNLVNLLTGVICQVQGVQITFSGQDGSIDPSNHQAIFSNFVTMTCPFQ